VTLTNAGTVLAAHAEAVARQLHAAREDLASLASLRTGQVHIAAFPSAAATFVPAALRDLADRAPHVTVRLTEAEPPEARALLATGDIDLAVVFSYDDVPEPPDDTVLRQPLFDDPLLLVLPADHPLAADADVELADLASGQWISGCARCRAHLLAAGGRRGFLPDIRHTTDDYVVTQALVAAGLGVALLPALALTAARDDRLTFLPVRDHAPRRIHLVQPRGPLSPAQRALSEVLRTVASNPRPSAPR
jgi:DNA-binding transcriptional LysR family regulator